MFWSPDGKYLMMQDTNNMVAVCDADSGQYLGSKQIEEGSALNWTPDGKNLVVTAMETDSVVFILVDFSTTDSVLAGGAKGNPWENQKVLEDLNDCFEALSKMLDPGTIEMFKNTEEKDAASFGWPGLGMALRNTWGLNEKTPLVRYFRRNGVTNPKEMTAIILKSYWRKLHDKPVEFGKTQK